MTPLIDVTLDSHHRLHIGNPPMFCRGPGRPSPEALTIQQTEGGHPDPAAVYAVPPGDHPRPFTVIPERDVVDRVWVPSLQRAYDRVRQYLHDLEARGRYRHRIWPIHCQIGTTGWTLQPDLLKAVSDFEDKHTTIVNTLTKGSNLWCEHFSPFEAEVPDPEDPSTAMNLQAIQRYQQADQVVIGGLARGHCLASGVRSIMEVFGQSREIEKLVLLTDCTADVAGLEFLGDAFVKDAAAKGMKLSTSTSYTPPPRARVHVLVIDPQVDFVEGGSLAVPGGQKALQNMAAFIRRLGGC